MKFKIKNKYGLILTEALVAVGMMATGSIILGSIVTTAVSTMAMSKDYLIAQNLATEGVEAVKIIRDTNWLMEPNDRTCWLRRDPELDCTVKTTTGSSYIAVQNNQNQYVLEGPQKRELNLGPVSSLDEYLLYYSDLPYVHDPSGTPSPYFRSIKFTDVSDESASFEVKVQWREGQKVRTIVMPVTLYNYL